MLDEFDADARDEGPDRGGGCDHDWPHHRPARGLRRRGCGVGGIGWFVEIPVEESILQGMAKRGGVGPAGRLE